MKGGWAIPPTKQSLDWGPLARFKMKTQLRVSEQIEIEDVYSLGIFAGVFISAKEKRITDIYMVENKPVRLGILKDYEIYLTQNGEPLVPSRYDIDMIVEKTMSPHNDMDFLVNTQGANNYFEYGFGINGYGRFRVSYTTSEEGVGMAMRKLPYVIPSVDEIDRFGFLRGIKDILNFRQVVPSGLILHTGITGSGKSTTIASEIDLIASKISGNILIFENPIEYKITMRKANVRHYEVNRHIKSFIEGMNIALRNNPTVIMVGEVRTRDEIEALIEIASKGHLVFSTLHTSNVMNTIRFLDEVGESKGSWRQLFANSIRAIVSQKLIYRDDFILLTEVFIPDSVAKTKMAEGQYTELENMIEGNQLRANGTISFKQAFDELVRQGVMNERDRREFLII